MHKGDCMNLSSNAIMIIAAVFGVSFLMMIPIALMQSKSKKKTKQFEHSNRDKALLHIYAGGAVIDGRKVRDLDSQRGSDMQSIVALSPGTHTIEAKYETSGSSLGKNVNYKTPRPIHSELNLEAGYTYTIGIYFYSPEQRYEYYKGDVGEAVSSQKLDISGGGLGYTEAYIICYKENKH